jgi:hypothetical protein
MYSLRLNRSSLAVRVISAFCFLVRNLRTVCGRLLSMDEYIIASLYTRQEKSCNYFRFVFNAQIKKPRLLTGAEEV